MSFQPALFREYDTDNVFARILRFELPCQKIYEDGWALAFYDIQPKASIHILVIPKGPYCDASHFHQVATSEEILGFYKACEAVVKDQGLYKRGYRAASHCGTEAGQEVFHFHVHLMSGAPL